LQASVDEWNSTIPTDFFLQRTPAGKTPTERHDVAESVFVWERSDH